MACLVTTIHTFRTVMVADAVLDIREPPALQDCVLVSVLADTGHE